MDPTPTPGRRARRTAAFAVVALATSLLVVVGGASTAQASDADAYLAAGFYHTCALTTAGDAQCWGWNSSGEAPSGGVAGPFTAITAGDYHTCALTTAGDAQCWGGSGYGQAPSGGVAGPFTAITAGEYHTCALTTAGDAQCWGRNSSGQAPSGGVAGPFIAITGGSSHSCALTTAGDAQCWGYNSLGQAPSGGVAGPFTAITAGYLYTCALTTGGDAQCWGRNSSGQAPSGGVAGPFIAITAGSSHTCALTTGGDAQCWGYNALGQAPSGGVAGPFTAITAGNAHTCALTTGGDARCWGRNSSGQAPAWVAGPFGPVADTAPDVGVVTGPAAPVALGSPAAVSAAFTPGDGTHTCTIDWSDGSQTAGTIDSGSCSGSHTYTTAGVYEVTVTVTDADGDADASSFQYVVVYDPTGGFVTGGGWIDSPAGAYAADTTLTGTATFGFVSKYKKGATAPDGSTQFQFAVAGLAFESTSYDWLVISGPMAQYKGSGTINGAGDYGFLLTANDGQVNGGGGTDTFRIKIWDTASGNVVYDNQAGAADTNPATLDIGGGSIVIHKAKG